MPQLYVVQPRTALTKISSNSCGLDVQALI